ncbi:hypothetical protein [Longimicrobium sp.]|uniref:hypothetical protein n=1 Tax=Longimicrobium sp. TaxID=2029185 RepID=UPI002E306EA7|nr:hypothetical protein [Longimicrobium sp.]HEX6040703.1 hypothetical protein [Longimicrobium sp.]
MGLLLLGIGLGVAGIVWHSIQAELPPVRPLRLAAVGILMLMILLAVWTAHSRADRYRITMFGARFPVLDTAGIFVTPNLQLGGDADSSDLYVPGRLPAQLARLEIRLDTLSRVDRVVLVPIPDVGVATLVREPTEQNWHIVGSRAIDPRTRVTVALLNDSLTLTAEPLSRPWNEPVRHRIRDLASGRTVDLPLMEGARPWVRSGRDPFRRVYPLADVLLELDSAKTAPPALLSSFFYYDNNILRLADLDSELSTLPAGTADTAVVWRVGEGSQRVALALPPTMDYRSYRLTPPERYGIRLLQSMRVDVIGRWIDVYPLRPRIFTLTDSVLENLSLQANGKPQNVWRIRLTANPQSLARRALFLGEVGNPLRGSGEAELSLPHSARDESFDVRTPGGVAQWTLGSPLPLSRADGPALLMRVDRHAFDWALVFGLVGVFALASAAFVFPQSAATFALALVGLGLASTRLLLGMGAFLASPYADSHPSTLWIVPLVPWTVVLLADAGRWMVIGPGGIRGWLRMLMAPEERRVVSGHAVVGGLIACLGWLITGRWMLPMLTGGILVLGVAVSAPWIRRAALSVGRWSMGVLVVFTFLFIAVRIGLGFAWYREMIPVFGTRLGLSILYTPVLTILLALLLTRWQEGSLPRTSASINAWTRLKTWWARREPPLPALGRILNALTGDTVRGRLIALAGILVLFLGIAYAVVALGVGDLGILLVGGSGSLVLLAYLGIQLPSTNPAPVLTRALLLSPLLIFVLIQANPLLLGGPRLLDGLEGETLRVRDWQNNDLRLIEQRIPEALVDIGHERSERLSVMSAIMRAYTTGEGSLVGRGFLGVPVSGDIAVTAPREHVPSAFIAAYGGWLAIAGTLLLLGALLLPLDPFWPSSGDPQDQSNRRAAWAWAGVFGVVGLVAWAIENVLIHYVVVGTALVVALLAFVSLGSGATVVPRTRWLDIPPRPALIAGTALLTLALAGVYMILSNYGITLFTGKNVYLLGLDSLSDVLESLALLGLAAITLEYHRVHTLTDARSSP